MAEKLKQNQRDGKLAVVILAAGQGSRMKSVLPKVLHHVLGEAMLGHVLRTAAVLEPDRLVVVTGHGREQVEAYVGHWTAANADLLGKVVPTCIEQPSPNGTGHAVLCAEAGWAGADEVLILYGDVPLLRATTLQGLLQERGGGLLSLLVADFADPTGYGRVVINEAGRITAVVEHKDATPAQRAIQWVNAGMMAVRADFLAEALRRLTPNNAQKELYLTDLLGFAAEQDEPGAAHILADGTEVQGVNQRSELALATRLLRERLANKWMNAGVTLEDPQQVWIEASVQLSPDVVLAPGVELRGRTVVDSGAHIERGCVLRKVTVGAGAHLLPYTVAEDAVIGPFASVGPFAHLRPGTVLGKKVKIGNFVETKKAIFGDAAKASHLSYIGDADIGPDCNIGAGTITCNYDGTHKYKTVLGRGVFIGSDTQLVAPVTLGDEAYVGAGTTVTQDVPAGALIFTRATATVKEGWVARKKAAKAAAASGSAGNGAAGPGNSVSGH